MTIHLKTLVYPCASVYICTPMYTCALCTCVLVHTCIYLCISVHVCTPAYTPLAGSASWTVQDKHSPPDSESEKSQLLSRVCLCDPLDCSPQGSSARGVSRQEQSSCRPGVCANGRFIWKLWGSHRHSSQDQPLGLLLQGSDSRPWGSWA